MEGWRPLTYAEMDAIWDRVDAHFEFDPYNGPGIKEPTPSITYAIGHVYGRPDAEELIADLDEAIAAALRRCVKPAEELCFLDWQHMCHWFRPHDILPTSLGVLPNGDDYFFMTEDLSLGVFGNCTAHTICAFGASLLAAIKLRPPRLFDRPIRVDGKAA